MMPKSTLDVRLDTVLVKVASRCNLNCDYCYVYQMGDDSWASMPKRMSQETLSTLAERLGELAVAQPTPFAVVLHGGEPLLLGAAALGAFFEQFRKSLPAGRYPLSIQTNGTLLSQELVDLAAKYRVSFSISCDGPPSVHDGHRLDHLGRGSHERVISAIRLLQSHEDAAFLFSGVLAVVDTRFQPTAIYDFFKDLGIPSADFLYRDGNHDRLPIGKTSFHSTEYGAWLAELLEIYLADPKPTFRVRVLDDLIRLVFGQAGRKEGIGVTNYGILIVDTDGSIQKNDTLKSAFRGADRFEQRWSINTHSFAGVVASAEFRRYHALQQPSATACQGCPELEVCGSGMVVHRWREVNGYDNPTVYCADQLLLIGRVRQQLDRYLSRSTIAA